MRVGKSQFVLKCLELKIRLRQKTVCFGFQRNESLLCSLFIHGTNLA
jgi:hypothetical protein